MPSTKPSTWRRCAGCWPTPTWRWSFTPGARTWRCCADGGTLRSAASSTPRWRPRLPACAPRPDTTGCWARFSGNACARARATPDGTSGRSPPSRSNTRVPTCFTCSTSPPSCGSAWRAGAGSSGLWRNVGRSRRPAMNEILRRSSSVSRASRVWTRPSGRSPSNWSTGARRPPGKKIARSARCSTTAPWWRPRAGARTPSSAWSRSAAWARPPCIGVGARC